METSPGSDEPLRRLAAAQEGRPEPADGAEQIAVDKGGSEEFRRILASADPNVQRKGPDFRNRWARCVYMWGFRRYSFLKRDLHDYLWRELHNNPGRIFILAAKVVVVVMALVILATFIVP